MIERYWNGMFREFKVGSGRFVIPGFPEPLMSPHFRKRNIIGGTPLPSAQCLKLCTFKKKHGTPEGIFRAPLGEALANPEYWRFQEEHHKEALPFMQRLLPFLVERGLPHDHFYLRDGKGIAATVIAGLIEDTGFLFNASVRSDLKGMGAARILMEGTQMQVGRPTFYWTVHPWFTLGADEVSDYWILP